MKVRKWNLKLRNREMKVGFKTEKVGKFLGMWDLKLRKWLIKMGRWDI